MFKVSESLRLALWGPRVVKYSTSRRSQPCKATASSIRSSQGEVPLLRDTSTLSAQEEPGIELATLRLPANPQLYRIKQLPR